MLRTGLLASPRQRNVFSALYTRGEAIPFSSDHQETLFSTKRTIDFACRECKDPRNSQAGVMITLSDEIIRFLTLSTWKKFERFACVWMLLVDEITIIIINYWRVFTQLWTKNLYWLKRSATWRLNTPSSADTP